MRPIGARRRKVLRSMRSGTVAICHGAVLADPADAARGGGDAERRNREPRADIADLDREPISRETNSERQFRDRDYHAPRAFWSRAFRRGRTRTGPRA